MRKHPFNPDKPEWLFRDLTRMHELATAAVFNDHGLSQFGLPVILFVVEAENDHGHFPTQREIAQMLNLSPTTITVSLKSLERHGCVRKQPDEEDMRKNRIEITEYGRRIAHECRVASDKVDEAMYIGFSEEEISLISSFYVRMTDNLRRLTPKNHHQQKEDPPCLSS